MNTSKIKTITAAVLVAVSALPAAAAYRPIPADSAVRIEKLPNGLTVYLRHNAEPAGQADFFLAQNVGSVNETEEQRGLAHFLEHMCFNGTRHFPGNLLIDYLESIGVKFGQNLNAYTSTDETVYNICSVPVQRQSAVDSCLLILRDWSHDLLLDDAEIDKERGVIEGEWRQRQGAATSRLLEKAVTRMYPGSVYGQRMPIGLMSVVRNFRPEALRDYYHKWYTPVNQCVVVVGDIDIDRTAERIRSLWADVDADASWTPSPELKVPDNDNIISVVETDPEQTAPSLMIYIKHDDLADVDNATILGLRRSVASDLAMSMLAERLDEIENSADAPFTNLGIGDRSFVMSRRQPALFMRVTPKPGREAEAISTVAAELQRAARFGFTPSELTRAKMDARAGNDNAYAARHKRSNTDRARQYVRHYLDGGILPSDEALYKMKKGVIGTIGIDSVNAYLSSIVTPLNRNVVLVAYMPDKSASLTETGLAQAWTGIDLTALTPYVDKFQGRELMTVLPVPGKIVAETADSLYDSKTWTLGNGAKVHIKKTDCQPNKIIISGYSDGGLSIGYDPALAPEYHLVNDILAVSAYGDIAANDLRRILAGRTIRHELKIENTEETLAASTTPADLTTAMQLLYLKATSLQKDSAAFERLIQARRVALDTHAGNPTYIMGDSIHATIYGRHPLGTHITADELDRVSYDKVMEIYRDRFADCSDFDFYIVGDFDEDSLRTAVCTYLASLPGAGRAEKPRDVGYRYASTMNRQWTTPMEVPQTICYSFYHAPCEYGPENLANSRVLSSVYATLLRRDLREDRGWTYGIRTHTGLTGSINGQDPSNLIMPVYIKVAPEHADSTFAIVHATAMAMADPANIPADLVASAKENLLKDMAEAPESNAFWMSVMHARDKYGVDMYNGFVEAIRTVTPETVARFAAATLAGADHIHLTMAPAENDGTPRPVTLPRD